jgi:gliding motility-associated lipoprotein GldH
MKSKKLFLFGLILAFISCNEKKIFSEYKTDFKANQWQKNDVKSFDITIDDESKNYDLTFILSHVFDYQFDKVPVTINIKNPKGETEIMKIDLILKDATGKDKGDCLGDICDLKQTFKKNVNLIKGNYVISVAHTFNNSYLPNISSLGLEVTLSE